MASADKDDNYYSNGEDDDENSPTKIRCLIDERRARNVIRNEKRMAEIKQQPSGDSNGPSRSNHRGGGNEDNDIVNNCMRNDSVEGHRVQGMAIPFKHNETLISQTEDDLISSLQELFPHRQAPILALVSLIRSTMVQTLKKTSSGITTDQDDEDELVSVPPPIFVTGPNSTGKTSIVRRTVQALTNDFSSQIPNAYINCATMCMSKPINALTEEIFHQLVLSRRDKEEISKSQFLTQRLSLEAPLEKALSSSSPERCLFAELSSAPPLETAPARDVDDNPVALDSDYNEVHEALDSDHEEDQLWADLEMPNYSSILEAENGCTIEVQLEQVQRGIDEAGPKRPLRAPMTTQSLTGSRNISASNIKVAETRLTSHAAVLELGRSLLREWDQRKLERCAILVVDDAEHLMSTSKRGQTLDRNNFLLQLLLLPRVFRLNLTIIAITNNALLAQAAANNLLTNKSSLGTVTNLVQPISIHFPAYMIAAEFIDILRLPRIQAQMIDEWDGDKFGPMCIEFRQPVIKSFVDTLVQSTLSYTRDLREIIRVGRSLWPVYLEPFEPGQIDQTILFVGACTTTIDIHSIQTKLKEFLTSKILPRIREALERMYVLSDGCPARSKAMRFKDAPKDPPFGIGLPRREDDRGDIPYLSKCLLLAAYICQHNHPDQDSSLFTIQRSGKRKRKQVLAKEGQQQQLTFGSTNNDQQQLKVLRPRTVLLERMLSVFVSIIGLHQHQKKRQDSPFAAGVGRDLMTQLGNQPFFNSLTHLRDLGLLRECSGGIVVGLLNTKISTIAPRYWTTLTFHEAELIAASIHFPISKYLGPH